MIPKSGYRFSEKIMLLASMIPKSGYRFSEKIMLLVMEQVAQTTARGGGWCPVQPALKDGRRHRR